MHALLSLAGFGLALLGLSPLLALAAETEPSTLRFYDEEGQRHLTLRKEGFGNTTVTVRFAAEAGSTAVWNGTGQRQDKRLTFARVAGEGEERGTFFVAEISESKAVIAFKPDQREPQDAGINGTYRRTSDAKLQQLTKKEFQAADERLQQALKTATKTWAPANRWALAIWKDLWTEHRQRWQKLTAAPPDGSVPGPASGTLPRPGNPNPNEAAAAPRAEDWLALAQASTRATYFIDALPDPKTGTDWPGEYDDLGGGHVSLRTFKDGRLTVSLSSLREPGAQEASVINATVPPAQLRQGKDGEWIAEFTYTDAEATSTAPPAKIKLTKRGQYLRIETENAQRYAGREWFDGIYRGAPVPPP